MGGLNRSFIEHGQGIVEMLRIIVVVRDGKIIAKGIDDNDDCFVERLRMPAPFRIRARVMLMDYDWGRGTIGFVFENQSSQKKSFGEEVYANGLKAAGSNQSVMQIGRRVEMNTQYPQKEADEEGMARFEPQLLLFIGLFHDLLRFRGLCTSILASSQVALWLWLISSVDNHLVNRPSP